MVISPTIEAITLLTAIVSGSIFPTYPPAGKPGHWHIASVLAHELYHGGWVESLAGESPYEPTKLQPYPWRMGRAPLSTGPETSTQMSTW